MLFILFTIGADRYALEASRVVEVVPMLELKRLPQPVAGVAGVFNYRGRPVPAMDLSAMTTSLPSTPRLSTRIIIVNHETPDGKLHPVGLIAEHATETLRCDSADFGNAASQAGGVPYLGPILTDQRGCIQWVYEERLLPEHVQTQLFPMPDAVSP